MKNFNVSDAQKTDPFNVNKAKHNITLNSVDNEKRNHYFHFSDMV